MIKRISSEELQSRIIYRDALLLVLNKPSGIAMHKAGVNLYNIEQYFPYLRFGLKNGPYLVHRLDRDTSGCLVLARNYFAARLMHRLFMEQKIKKSYLAWVHGLVAKDFGLIDIPLKKQSEHNWLMMPHKDGVKAITYFEVILRVNHTSLLRLKPETGRTHQLRVHCQYLGHPIIGDKIYNPITTTKPMHLHAHHIEIPLYKKKPPQLITSPPPPYMIDILPDGISI